MKKQVLGCYAVSDCGSTWFRLSSCYFMDFLMQEDLATRLSESSFVEEGLGMRCLHELLEGEAAEEQELVGWVRLFLRDAALN